MREFEIRDNQVYVPDFLVNDKFLVEIKIEKLVFYKTNIAKFILGQRYSSQNKLVFRVLTEKILDVFNEKQLECFARQNKEDLKFYRKKDREKFLKETN